MTDALPPDDDLLDRWTIPLDEPESPPVPPPTDEAPPPPTDFMRLADDPEPYPTEGYHPRLGGFGDAA